MKNNKVKKDKNVEEKKGRFFKGVVISDKMDKTVVVLVNRYKKHPKYKRRYKVGKKYKVHDEKNEYKKEDKVIIQECRPISKNKKWKVIKLDQLK
ncbi:MAG: 30S ribosomal protein S17 [Parcubacteria group bacterium]|nr:30S ribosomal protein S17 [Parcubacteria group bacterium]